MKFNKWTLTLAAAGVVSLGSVAQGEEAKNQVLTALSSTTLSGYVDTSAIWKFGTGGFMNNTMPGRAYDGAAKQDGFNLNVIKLTLEKPLDEGQWAAGYKVDLLFGPDATYFKSFSGGGAASQDFAVQQAYVNLRAPVGNGLDFKMGVFDSIIGYESFDSYKNPNYSRSYGYSITPRTHTGLLASYQVAEWMNLMAGIADTTFGGINSRPFRFTGPADESEKTYMAGFVLTAPESFGAMKGAALYAGVVNGLNGAPAPTSQSDVTAWYAGVSIPTPLTGLSVGACYNYTGNTANSGVQSFYANASALYLTYQATEKLKLNNRAEYATSNGIFGTGTSREQFFGETFTVDYALWANVTTRAEFRWDRDLTARNGVPAAFGNDDKSAFSLALNVIYKF